MPLIIRFSFWLLSLVAFKLIGPVVVFSLEWLCITVELTDSSMMLKYFLTPQVALFPIRKINCYFYVFFCELASKQIGNSAQRRKVYRFTIDTIVTANCKNNYAQQPYNRAIERNMSHPKAM
jgi:hypothetical protein